MKLFLYISGVLFWIVILYIFLIRYKKGHKWISKKVIQLAIGTGVIESSKKLAFEINNRDLTSDTFGEFIGNLLMRFSRIGIITLFIASLPMFLLYRQNSLISTQNKLITFQNAKIDIQNSLAEADRRSSLMFIMNDLLDEVEKELNSNDENQLNDQLKGRLIAISNLLKPYRQLEGNELSQFETSPERGHLFLSLFSYSENKETLKDLIQRINFSFSDLRNSSMPSLKLERAFLDNSNLSFSNLNNSTISTSKINHGVINNSSLNYTNISACMDYSFLNFSTFISSKIYISCIECEGLNSTWNKSNLGGSNFSNAYLEKGFFIDSELRWTNFKNANLRETKFIRSKMIYTIFDDSNLSYTDFQDAEVHGASFQNVNFEGIQNVDDKTFLNAKSLYKCKNLPSGLSNTLKRLKPCLFTENGCSVKAYEQSNKINNNSNTPPPPPPPPPPPIECS